MSRFHMKPLWIMLAPLVLESPSLQPLQKVTLRASRRILDLRFRVLSFFHPKPYLLRLESLKVPAHLLVCNFRRLSPHQPIIWQPRPSLLPFLPFTVLRWSVAFASFPLLLIASVTSPYLYLTFSFASLVVKAFHVLRHALKPFVQRLLSVTTF